MSSIIAAIIAGAWPCVFAYVTSRLCRWRFITNWLLGAAGETAVSLALRWWLPLAGSVAGLLVALAYWWRNRQDRKKTASLAGAKSRAIRDALVRRAREAAEPRPVLQPHRQVAP